MDRPDPFQIIADPTRRELLDRLASGDKTAGELARGIKLSQPALSKHLRILRQAGLVTARSEGRLRIYSENREGLSEVIGWLEDHQAFWQQRLGVLGQHLARKAGKGRADE